MTLDQIYADLTELVNCGDPTFANAANHIGQMAQQCQAGQMSPEELTEILEDIQRQLNILQNMEQMAVKEKLNTCINGLIAIAGAV
jgi:hypothetical protein